MKRPHITVVNYYSVFPFNNGGKLAIRDFYKALSEWFDITIVCLSGFHSTFVSPLKITEHLTVISLQLSGNLERLEEEIRDEYKIDNRCEATWAMSIVRGGHNCPELVAELHKISADSSIIITEHVYTYRLVKAIAESREDLSVWYRAQNVEYDYKLDTWSVYDVPLSAYDEVFELEKDCCAGVDLILTITEKDTARFRELYGAPNEKMLDISAGYDAESIRVLMPGERRKKIKTNRFSALYISSSAQVAVDAANHIAKSAENFPDILFYIAGSVGLKMDISSLPENVNILGLVSDDKKTQLLEGCDFAFNPIVGGSGLNIKMLEYFASGIPVICTEFGARGIAVEDGVNCLITEIDALGESIKRILSLSVSERDKIAENAYELYINNYTWRNCALKTVSYAEQRFSLELKKHEISPDSLKLIKYIEGKSLVPEGEVYIYGAGEWGRQCASHMRSLGITPVAFLDKDTAKHGKQIFDIVIQPPDTYHDIAADCTIIFALADFTDAVKMMLSKGLKYKNVAIAIYGTSIFLLSDGRGCVPYYIDINKIQRQYE